MLKALDPTKNIVICCDGTGMEPRARANTNVYEVAGLARRSSEEQVVFYDPGLGTESDPAAQTWIAKGTTKVLGLAFAFGLKKNVGDAYTFLMDFYEPGDRIYMFGFSRGAYTVRAIAGMLRAVGLMQRGCHNLLPYALKVYMQQSGKREWELEAGWKRTFCQRVPKPDGGYTYTIPIQFLGVWDTVKSVGLFRKSVVLPYTDSLPNVLNGRHAIALDEKRSKYRPDHWTAAGSARGEIQSVWFRGVHTDVGGGYAETERGLADYSLAWMLDGAERAGMLFDREDLKKRHEERIGYWKLPEARRWAEQHQDDEKWTKLVKRIRRAKNWTKTLWRAFETGELESEGAKLTDAARPKYDASHNSLLPIWWILLFWRRKLPMRAWIHGSVKQWIDRMSEEERGSPDAQLQLLPRLARAERVVREDSTVLVWCGTDKDPGDVLIQQLTGEESKHLGTLPNDPEAAIHALLVAGIKAWRDALAALFGTLSLDDDPEKDEQKKVALRQDLQEVQQAIERREIKGGQGAFDLLMAFLRKTTLKADQDRQIAAASPHLVEALAECPPKLTRKEVTEGLAALSEISLEEYGMGLEQVLVDPDREQAAKRLQRLTGILLKRPFATARDRDTENQPSVSGARRSWEWDLARLEGGVEGASAELDLLNRLRSPGSWNERAPEGVEEPSSWEEFTDDVESERGLFKIVALYIKDRLEKKETKTLAEYYRAKESEGLQRGLDLATFVFESTVTGPLLATLGVPGLVVGMTLFIADWGFSRFADQTLDRIPDGQS